MPSLPAFRLADKDRPGFWIEIAGAKAGQLAIAAAGEERRLDEIPKVPLRGIDQPGDFIFREITEARRVNVAKGLHRPPCDVVVDLAIAKGLVQRRAQDGQHAVCACPPLAYG